MIKEDTFEIFIALFISTIVFLGSMLVFASVDDKMPGFHITMGCLLLILSVFCLFVANNLILEKKKNKKG